MNFALFGADFLANRGFFCYNEEKDEGAGNVKRIFAFLLLLFLALPSCAKKPETFGEDLLHVRFLDVGEGLSVLLSTKQGNILIDTGGEETQESLCRRLHQLNVKDLELLILTHTDEDHIGGADGVIGEFSPKEIWINDAEDETDSFYRLQESLQTASATVTTAGYGDTKTVGNVTLTVLSPEKEKTERKNGNEDCLCVYVTAGEIHFLLMADAEEKTEKELLKKLPASQLQADVLLVGHHGSNTSSTEAFLQTVSPKFAVISCGAGNRNGHPDGRVLARIRETNAEILRTDREGEICFRTDGTELFLGD